MKIKLGLRIWILIIALLLSLLSIFGTFTGFQEGVLIKSVEPNSTAMQQGLVSGQIITQINEYKIESPEDYAESMKNIFLEGQNESKKITIKTKETEAILYINHVPEIVVGEIPLTSIKTGLDLSGGSRALVKAKNETLSSSELNDLVQITRNRFNEFGLSDVKVNPISDLEGNNFMSIEIAGATPEDLKQLVSEQGKFEAKIGNQTVFEGGTENGVASVARSGQGAGIESCQKDPSSGIEYCNFRFTV